MTDHPTGFVVDESRVPDAPLVAFLEELPLLPNGKINRLALPVPSVQRPALPVTYKAPRHPLEWQIALIWRELLKVPKVGVFDDFFDLGGHSLLAVRLMQRLETATPVAPGE